MPRMVRHGRVVALREVRDHGLTFARHAQLHGVGQWLGEIDLIEIGVGQNPAGLPDGVDRARAWSELEDAGLAYGAAHVDGQRRGGGRYVRQRRQGRIRPR